MNVRADELAGQFNAASNHKLQTGPMIEGTKCQLVISNQFIPSHQRTRLRDVRRTEQMKIYIKAKTRKTDSAFDNVDWQSHELAVNSSKLPQQFLVKFLHKWLPVGKQTHRYSAEKHDGKCPSCSALVEDFDHFLCCPSPTRRRWRTELRIALTTCANKTNTDPTITDLIIEGLLHYLRSTPNPPTPPSPRFVQLINHQSDIGWLQLFLGRWSKEWTVQQLQYLTTNNITPTPHNHGPSWLRSFIHIIWSHCHEEWIARNNALHGQDNTTKRQARLEKAKYRIRALYQFKQHCTPYQKSRWFYPSPEIHFERETKPSQLENWIAINESRIFKQHQHHKSLHQQGQYAIYDLFRPQQHPHTTELPQS